MTLFNQPLQSYSSFQASSYYSSFQEPKYYFSSNNISSDRTQSANRSYGGNPIWFNDTYHHTSKDQSRNPGYQNPASIPSLLSIDTSFNRIGTQPYDYSSYLSQKQPRKGYASANSNASNLVHNQFEDNYNNSLGNVNTTTSYLTSDESHARIAPELGNNNRKTTNSTCSPITSDKDNSHHK